MNDYVPIGKGIVGTCGNCGGRVLVDSPWFGIVAPLPRCDRCGATPAAHGPVLPMNPPQYEAAPYRFDTTASTTFVPRERGNAYDCSVTRVAK